MWQNKTISKRKNYSNAVQKEYFDPPSPLSVSLPTDDFLYESRTESMNISEKEIDSKGCRKNPFKEILLPSLFNFDEFPAKLPST